MKNKTYKEVFLAVIGITPQVLTECLFYYYSPFYEKRRYFDRVKVFTTLDGKNILIKKLFNEKQLSNLENALKITKGTIPFSSQDIILFSDHKGESIHDIRTTEQNESSLKVLHDELKRWTSDKSTRVTATVAGGRKTMSTQIALAFQLFGREHDELIHIIAPDEKMDPTNPESKSWFFPADPSDPAEKLDISTVPVLRVGRYLSHDLDLPISKLVDKLQMQIVETAPIDELIVENTSFICGKETLKLSPLLSSYMRYFIRRKLNSDCANTCEGCKSCFVQNAEMPELIKKEILEDHGKLYSSRSGHFEKTKNARESADYFECLNMLKTDLSNLRRAVRQADISDRFKKSIILKSLKLEPGNKQLKWHGIAINSDIIEFQK